MISLGKKIEAFARRLRPYFNSAARNAYRELLARGLSQRRPGEPLVVCDLSDQSIDAVGGRYYFSLLLDLIDAGYFPVLVAHRQTVSTFGTSVVKSMLLEKRLGTIRSITDLDEPFDRITDSAAKAEHAGKVVRTDYGWRLPEGPEEMPFPVFVHPRIAIGGQLPFSYDSGAIRPARIFFGGNTSAGKYDRNTIGELYGMLTRREMLDTVISSLSPEEIHRPADPGAWLDGGSSEVFVLCETQHAKIPPARWLEALSKGDFFLACPGVGMPLCHNLVEAMAAGSIPILQYRQYLTPELEDGVNCIAFRDGEGLREAIRKVTGMGAEEIQKLRRNVRHYYDTFLAPGRFAKRLLASSTEPSTLLMNSYRVPR